ncbi:MAG: PD-(D/E)XK nuclease family protein [Alphaproteobacteria bacterium]|nr:PD-(D/E)XK nuclease family protein [Alphaproteobacteria bacterium]
MVGIASVVIAGRAGFAIRRAEAARASQCGLRIMTLPQLAARLAGGFTTPLSAEALHLAVQTALSEGGFVELDAVRTLPGMTRAVARTLRRIWDADFDLKAQASRHARLGDVYRIEQRLRGRLPPAMMLPRDLRDAALGRVNSARSITGPIIIEGLSFIAPIWRPLVSALGREVAVEWRASVHADTEWFQGKLTAAEQPASAPAAAIISCADPHHEVVESLRWARALITSGRARPQEIAIAAASTAPWDEYFRFSAEDGGLRLHFGHGIPALTTKDGQSCAALADILLRGVSRNRVVRLAALSDGGLEALPRLLAALPRAATLARAADWQHAVARAIERDSSLGECAALSDMIAVLAAGMDGAEAAAALFLRGRARALWDASLRAAPPPAIELSLQYARLPSANDAADSILWCSARDLAAVPRPFVRLLGLTNRNWPRRSGHDPILPDHIVAAEELDHDPLAKADRRHFDIILESAWGEIVLSRGRRSAHGSRLGRSSLLRHGAERSLARARIPEHAWNESDRLMARPEEAATLVRVASADQCWRDWHRERLTRHDGQFDASHPQILRALGKAQSATSLKMLLRDPLGFVWRYALGFRSAGDDVAPLTISADEFGHLVHQLLHLALEALGRGRGVAGAGEAEITSALDDAVAVVEDSWPRQFPVPPDLLWRSTLERAAALARIGLSQNDVGLPGTRIWSEVAFGQAADFQDPRDLPWDPARPVRIPGTTIALRGRIDRLDLRADHSAVRVTDYKSASVPARSDRLVIAGGRELQRALSALACQQLTRCPRVLSRLFYLGGEGAIETLKNPDEAIKQIAAFVDVAVTLLRRGSTVPGPETFERSNPMRLLLPASPGYERRKRAGYSQARNAITRYWNLP